MSRTPTHRPGRLRALAVASALAVSMVAGGAAPALAAHGDDVPPSHAAGPSDHAKGLHEHQVEARTNAAHAPWNTGEDADDFGGDFTTQGWSWF